MGSNSDWYAKKLGGGAAPPQRSDPTPRFTPMPGQSAPPRRPPTPEQPYEEDEDVPEGHIRVGNAITKWRGGAGNKDATSCPECGSSNYFTRTNREGGGRWSSDRYPAPHCFDCGFPIVQIGSVGGELGGGA